MRRAESWCRRSESNTRPMNYETLALPLSYAGVKQPLMLRIRLQRCQGALNNIYSAQIHEAVPIRTVMDKYIIVNKPYQLTGIALAGLDIEKVSSPVSRGSKPT